MQAKFLELLDPGEVFRNTFYYRAPPVTAPGFFKGFHENEILLELTLLKRALIFLLLSNIC